MLAGKYQLRQIIGRGGFGLVYDALHLGIDRQIALKVLLPEWSNKDPELALRFRREAVLSSQLRHPNTITVYDYGQTSDNVLFMAMEYVEGRTLSTVLRDEAPLPPERVVHILKQILASLHEAHRRGIIHRDLKPGNIMLTSHRGDNEFVKVLDFGIAKAISNDLLGGEQVSQTLTQAGQFCGTPRYMAPEQFRNGAITPACDLYSVGLISYELLTGKPAIVGETMVDLIVAQVAGPSLTLPGDLPLGQSLRQPLHRALRKDPSDRFATAESFLSALEDWDAEEPLFDDELEPTRLEDSNDQTHEGLREAPARRNLNDLNDLDDLDELGDLGLTPIARDPGDITALPTFTLGLTRDDEFPDPFDEPVTDQAERQKHAARAALDFDAPSGLTQPSRSDHLDRFALPPVEDDPPGFPLPDEPITDEFPPAFRRAAGEPPAQDVTTDMARSAILGLQSDLEPTIDISRNELFGQKLRNDLQKDLDAERSRLQEKAAATPPPPQADSDATVDMPVDYQAIERDIEEARRARMAARAKEHRAPVDEEPSPRRRPRSNTSSTTRALSIAGLIFTLIFGALVVIQVTRYVWNHGLASKVGRQAEGAAEAKEEGPPTVALDKDPVDPVQIAVTSAPPGAQVIVDDRAVGRTPLNLLADRSKTVRLRVKLDDHIDYGTELKFRANRALSVELTPRD